MAFEFDCDGFLSARRSELEADVNSTFGAVLTVARSINHDCHSLILGADVRNRDPQALLVTALFLRALEHYQATLLFLGTGLIATARATLRILIETVFLVRAVAASEEALSRYIGADLIHRRKAVNRARNQNHSNLTELRQTITSELIKELDNQIQVTGAKALSVEELSKTAGMHDWYITAYALVSKSVHTQAREAEAYFKLDEHGEVRELVYAPSMEEIPFLALTAADSILMGASAVDELFGRDFSCQLDEHRGNMKAAWEHWSD